MWLSPVRGRAMRGLILNASAPSERSAQGKDFHPIRRLSPLAVLLAVSLSGCDKPATQAAAPPALPVTVAEPTKRTVTDWDEFTGRFEAMEEVQIRARVGGFVDSIQFKDGDFVKPGDLLYVIDSRPFEAVALQADGQLADARAKAELARRELERALTLVTTSARSRCRRTASSRTRAPRRSWRGASLSAR